MGTQAEDMKGRAKEAAGALSGDDQLKREGQVDQKAAAAKDKVKDATEKLDEVIDTVKEKAVGATDRPAKKA
jgi:uncharacterized protein YjbJ (UPF0337 family)